MVVWRMLFVGGGEVKLASVSEIGLSFSMVCWSFMEKKFRFYKRHRGLVEHPYTLK